MGNCFRFKATHELDAKEISALRRICSHSIVEIRRRALAQELLLDIPVFSGGWPACKAQVVMLLENIENGTLPLAISSVETEDNSHETEEPFSLEQARRRLLFLREISLEQDMLMQLEQGYISSPDEYVPLPENEA